MSPRPRAGLGRTALREFLRTEQAAGAFLIAATALALVWANVLAGYETFWRTELRFGGIEDFRHWVNDGLMTIFFFVVSLEIKRELVVGELRDRRIAALPVFAAVGGMIGPALIFLALNAGGPGERGWGVPMATDIAFAIGVLALLGPRVPHRLRLFLLTLAIVDDIGAIAIIAVAYSDEVAWRWLGVAGAALLVLILLRAASLSSPLLYLAVGVGCWLAATRSGVHPTLAGVALGLLTPAYAVRGRMVLERLESLLHPVSSYVVVPLFALANAGVLVSGEAIRSAISSPVFWGIVLGLVVGKTVGITVSALAAERLPLAGLPPGVDTRAVIGGAAVAGIGFTVSLFILGLAFDDARLITDGTLGVLAGSTASGILGAAILVSRRGRIVRGA